MAPVRSRVRVVLAIVIVVAMSIPTGALASASNAGEGSESVHTPAHISDGTGLQRTIVPPIGRGHYRSEVPIASAVHDLTVNASNLTTLAGDLVHFTAQFPGNATSYEWVWGDGNISTSPSGQENHTYDNAGIYLVYVAANNTAGVWHDDLDSLLRFAVQNSFAADAAGNLVQLGGNVVANATNQTVANAIVAPGGFLQVSNWIMEQPSNPNWIVRTPSYNLSAPSGTFNVSTPILSTTSLNALTVGVSPNATAGIMALNFTVPTQDNLTAPYPTAFSNFTFTVVVGDARASTPSAIVPSPHPGVLDVREDLNFTSFEANPNQDWPAPTIDPALLQSPNSVAESVEQEVYQTLISYNGSDVGVSAGDYVPDLATCVPGSAQCVALYGSNLSSAAATTFVINPNATFYNSTTGARFPVEPNDVAFSLVRECLALMTNWCGIFVPFFGGGIRNESNQSWDGGLHYYENNTPPNLLHGILVNDSAYCTPEMRDGIHGAGCVTLNTSVNPVGQPFSGSPALLEYIAEPSASVYSCDWMASIGYGLPGWTNGTQCFGSPPGDPGNPNPVPGNLAWDSYIRSIHNLTESSSNFSKILVGPSSRHAVGSGPYYLESMTEGTCFGTCVGRQNYTLQANPYWGGTTCQGGTRLGCLPEREVNATSPPFIPTVHVYLGNSVQSEIAGIVNGTSDLTLLPEASASTLAAGEQGGLLGVVQAPTDDISFYSYNLNYSAVEAENLTGIHSTLPAGALQDYDLRRFLTAAYPSETVQDTSCLQYGLEFCFQFGGMFPSYDTGLTPTNLTWPVENPSSNATQVNSAAWWWNQTSHDALVGQSCTQIAPCTFPIAVPVGDPALVLSTQEWGSEIQNLSGGALVPSVVQLGTGARAPGGGYLNVTSGHGEVHRLPFPIAFNVLDPTDMLPSSYLTLHTNWGGYAAWSFNTIVANDSNSCGGSQDNPQITQSCQGWALADVCCMFGGLSLFDTSVADQIAANLSLYVPSGQTTLVASYAPWIDPTTLNLNPILTAEGLVGQPFYDLQYRTTIPLGYPLTGGTVSGLKPLGNPTEAPSRPSTSPVEVTLGTTIPLLISVAGGSGVYNYAWSGLPSGPGCVTINQPSLRCKPADAGTYAVEVKLTDSKGEVTNASLIDLIVAGPMSIQSFTAKPASVTAGYQTQLNVSVAGGAEPFTFSYSGLPLGCASADTPSLACIPTSAGNYSVDVVAADLLGQSAAASLELDVSPGPILASSAISPATGSVMEGGTLAFTASITCSLSACPPGATYSWALTNTLASLNAITGNPVRLTAGETAGTVTLYVNSTLNGVTKEATAIITISSTPVPALASVSVTPSSPSVTVGTTQAFTAYDSCNGGTCPSGTTYTWRLNTSLGALSSTSGSATVFTAGPKAGSVTLSVMATLNDITKWNNVTITLQAKSSSSPGFLGLSGDTGYLLIGVIVAVVAIAAALLLLRGRVKRPTPKSPSQEEPESREPEESETEKALEKVDTSSEPERKT